MELNQMMRFCQVAKGYKGDGLTIFTPDETYQAYLATHFKYEIVDLIKGMGIEQAAIRVGTPDNPLGCTPYRIHESFQPTLYEKLEDFMAILTIANYQDMPDPLKDGILSTPFRALCEIAENPEKRLNLDFLGTEKQIKSGKPVERQVAVSDALKSNITGTKRDAVKRRRSDFWFPDDLAAFNSEWVKYLDANNPGSEMFLEWRMHAPNQPAVNHRKVITKFQLFEEAGYYFHLTELLEVTPL